ncbi:MAG: DMT family transporter [Bacteroidota bacterium]
MTTFAALKIEMQKGIKYMFISSLAFGVMNLIVKSLNRFPTSELILFRSVISLIISFYFIKKLNLKPFGNNKKWLIIRGTFGVIALSLFFFTLHNLPLATAITIQYMSPIFTAIIAIFLLNEKMGPFRWVFFGISFAGIAMVKGFSSNISWIYLIAGILSALFSGFAYNAIRKLRDSDHPVVIVFYFPLIATPVTLVWSYFEWVNPIGWEWGLLILIGIFTQIAQIYMTKALAQAEANVVSIMKYIGIVYALGFDYLIFGTTYTLTVIIGIVFVISGVLLNLFYKKIPLPSFSGLKLRK